MNNGMTIMTSPIVNDKGIVVSVILLMSLLMLSSFSVQAAQEQDNKAIDLTTPLNNLFSKLRQPLIDERERLTALEAQLCPVALPKVTLKQDDLSTKIPKMSSLMVIATPEPFVAGEPQYFILQSSKTRYSFKKPVITNNLPATESATILTGGSERSGQLSFEIELVPLALVKTGVCKGTFKMSGNGLSRSSRRMDIANQLALPEGVHFIADGRIAVTTEGKHKITHTNAIFIENKPLGTKNQNCARHYALNKPKALSISELTNRKHESLDVFGMGVKGMKVVLKDGREFDLKDAATTLIDLPIISSSNALLKFTNEATFFVRLSTSEGEQEIKTRLNVLATKEANEGKIEIRFGQELFETKKKSNIGFNVLLNPVNLRLAIVEQETTVNGEVLLERSNDYIARVSFESEQDFSKKTETLSVSRIGVFSINKMLETNLADHISTLSSGKNTLSFKKVDKQWQTDLAFKLIKEDVEKNTLQKILSSQGSATLDIRSNDLNIRARLISSVVSQLHITGQHGEGDDKPTSTELDVFFGAGYSRAQDRKVVIKAHATLENKTETTKTSISKDTPWLKLIENGANALSCDEGECRPSGQAVGSTRLDLSLNNDAIPAGVLINGQESLKTKTSLTLRVTQLQLIKGKAVEAFSEQELQQQRQELAGELFKPEDIHVDQLERRRSLLESVSLITKGSVNMSAYSVQWHFSGGSVGTSFVQISDDQWESKPTLQGDKIPTFTKIDLLDAEQQTVGEYRNASAINSQLGTSITLVMENRPELGTVVDVKAFIRNPPFNWFNDHSRALCRWSVGKVTESSVLNVGIFKFEDTPVDFSNQGQLNCRNQLVFHRISDNVGVQPDVTVQLIDGGSR